MDGAAGAARTWLLCRSSFHVRTCHVRALPCVVQNRTGMCPMRADAAFARTFEYLDMEPSQLLDDRRLALTVVYGHVLEARYLSSDIPTDELTELATYE